MILAAGLGTRLRPLSSLCAKPALPVRGVPVIAYTLALLARHGVTEVVINLHHLPETVRASVERHRPTSITVTYNVEPGLLGTGGGMKAAAAFLRESDPSIILAGDMLLDVDLTAAVERHRERTDAYTLLLRADDPRAAAFGTIGADDAFTVRRIGERFDLGGETQSALFTGVRIAAARAMSGFPSSDAFEDLSDWQAPRLARGARDIRADWLPFDACTWEPVGTPREYLDVNLLTPELSYAADVVGARAAPARGAPPFTRLAAERADVIVGAGADVHPTAILERVVVWAGERVPAGTRARDGVFAAGRFHPCPRENAARASDVEGPAAPGDGKLRADLEPGRLS